MNKVKCLDCFELAKGYNKVKGNPLESSIGYIDELLNCVEIYTEDMLYENMDGLKCSICSKEIEVDEYFLSKDKEELLSKQVGLMIAEEVSLDIDFCSECEKVKKIQDLAKMSFDKDCKKIYPEGKNIYDFLKDYDVFKDNARYVIPFLYCKHCSYGYDIEKAKYIKGSFDESKKIFSWDEIMEFNDKDIKE